MKPTRFDVQTTTLAAHARSRRSTPKGLAGALVGLLGRQEARAQCGLPGSAGDGAGTCCVC